MSKILLALSILGAGMAGSLTAHYSTTKLQLEASAARQACIVETQTLADAQSERARLAEHIRDSKQSLTQAEAAANQNPLWSVLETNRIGHLAPDLREHLLEELGFNWNWSKDFIVVSKETVRVMRNNQELENYHEQEKLIDYVAALLALTPQERSQVETAMERVEVNLKDWAISHTERAEPKGDVLAQYTLQSAPPTSIANFTEVLHAIGRERTALLMLGTWQGQYEGSISAWMRDIGMSDKPTTMILKRFSDGDRQVLKAQVFNPSGTAPQEGEVAPWTAISKDNFPSAFLPLFPTGWADVAQREGFTIPTEPDKK